jgi:RecA-family ATPase
MLEACSKFLKPDDYKALLAAVADTREKVRHRTAWRIEATLREFQKPPMVNLWFDYPVHHLDEAGSLKDVDAEGEAPPWQKASDKRKANAKKAKKSKKEEFEFAYQAANFGEPPTLEALVEAMNLSKRTVERYMKDYDYIIIKGKVYKADAIEKSPS